MCKVRIMVNSDKRIERDISIDKIEYRMSRRRFLAVKNESHNSHIIYHRGSARIYPQIKG